jgi:hypothetical protein
LTWWTRPRPPSEPAILSSSEAVRWILSHIEHFGSAWCALRRSVASLGPFSGSLTDQHLAGRLPTRTGWRRLLLPAPASLYVRFGEPQSPHSAQNGTGSNLLSCQLGSQSRSPCCLTGPTLLSQCAKLLHQTFHLASDSIYCTYQRWHGVPGAMTVRLPGQKRQQGACLLPGMYEH